jgi:hypothetical protein
MRKFANVREGDLLVIPSLIQNTSNALYPLINFTVLTPSPPAIRRSRYTVFTEGKLWWCTGLDGLCYVALIK